MAADASEQLEAIRQKIANGTAMFDRDVEHRMHALATEASARYALDHFPTAPGFRGLKRAGAPHLELLDAALARVPDSGFCAEFGVGRGETLTFIANETDRVVYGFDSFQGLPEDWSARARKGAFSQAGKEPDLSGILFKNYRLVTGMFADTIPTFAAQVSGPAALLHLDCYCASSARTVFEGLGDRMGPGTVLVIRQFFNFPGWERGIFEVFEAFCGRTGLTAEFIGFTPTLTGVALILR